MAPVTTETQSVAALRAAYTGLVEGMLALNARVDQKLAALEANELHMSSIKVPLPARKPACPQPLAVDARPRQSAVGVKLQDETRCNRDEVAASEWLPLTWNPDRCGSKLQLHEGGEVVSKDGSRGWNAAAIASKEVSRFRLRIRASGDHGSIMVGFVKTGGFLPDRRNFDQGGWVLQCSNGVLNSCSGDYRRPFRTGLTENDVVEACFNSSTSEISFAVNEEEPKVAFHSVEIGDDVLMPYVEISDPGACVALLGGLPAKGSNTTKPVDPEMSLADSSGPPALSPGASPIDASGTSEELAVGHLATSASTSSPSATYPLRWDASRCGSKLAISNGGCVVAKNGCRGWNAAVLGSSEASCFKVRIVTWGDHGAIMVGFARRRGFDPDRRNFDRCGWVLQCSSGAVSSCSGDVRRAFRDPLAENDILEAQFDREKSQITFAVNGDACRVAFSSVSVDDDVLVPYVEISDQGACVAIED